MMNTINNMTPEFYAAVLSVLNFLIIIILAVLGFMVKRIFTTSDLQFKLLSEIREFVHHVDKRVIVLETHHKFTVVRFRDKEEKQAGYRE